MTRSDFENKYLNKLVEVVLFDNDTFKGYLYSTNDYMNTTNRLDKKNYYFIGNDIRENNVRFRKSHIKKIRLLSCVNIINELEKYMIKEQARIVINNTDEDEFIYTDLLIKLKELKDSD